MRIRTIYVRDGKAVVSLDTGFNVVLGEQQKLEHTILGRKELMHYQDMDGRGFILAEELCKTWYQSLWQRLSSSFSSFLKGSSNG